MRCCENAELLTSTDSIVSSEPFRFYVGPDKTEYSIHSDLVSRQSKVLAALVYNCMKETTERCVTWEDIETLTFARFAEFVYTGTYTNPQPAPSSSLSAYDSGGLPCGSESPVYKSGRRQRTNQWRTSTEQSAFWQFKLDWAADGTVDCLDNPAASYKSDEDFTDVFLAHAKVYVLADRYSIPTLMDVSIKKLLRALNGFTMFEQRTGDVVALLEYSCTNGPGHLENLVAAYCGCFLKRLWGDSLFRVLCVQHPEIAFMLMGNFLNATS